MSPRSSGIPSAGRRRWVEDIAALQLGRPKLEQVPPDRLSALARYRLSTKAPKLERTPEPKLTAMLTALMRHVEAKAIDDALDLFEILMATRPIGTAKRSTDKQCLSTLPQLEKAARITARVPKVVIEELELVEETGCDVDVAALWRALEEIAPQAATTAPGLMARPVAGAGGRRHGGDPAARGSGVVLRHRQTVPVAAG
ncbi:hypothetical protein OG496_11330 [Streptomyces sp. NBC_00988]|nr:hypothetical protein OG496_11330 [Streptomyces sp. NBC_00988]